MIKIIIFLILLLIPTICLADKWTYSDTAIQSLYSGLQIADWNQTLQIKGRDDLKEANKILGEHPSDDQVNAYFTIAILGHYYIANKLNQPYRAYWQMFWISPQFATIENNNKNSLKVNFKF